jgi:hypothetical protein
MGEIWRAYRVLVAIQDKRPLRRPKYRWKDIKMDLKKLSGKMWTAIFWLRTGMRGELW